MCFKSKSSMLTDSDSTNMIDRNKSVVCFLSYRFPLHCLFPSLTFAKFFVFFFSILGSSFWTTKGCLLRIWLLQLEPLSGLHYHFEAEAGGCYILCVAMEADTQVNYLSFEITRPSFFLLLLLYCCIIILVVECISNYVHNLHLLFENRLLKCQIIIYSSNFGLQYVVFLIAFMYKCVVLDSLYIPSNIFWCTRKITGFNM